MKPKANRQVSEMGANLLFLFPQLSEEERRQANTSVRAIEFELFHHDDTIALEKAITVPHRLTALVNGQAAIRYGNETMTTDTYGIDEYYEQLFNFKVEKGRSISRGDVQSSAKVAILGPEAVKTLFGKDNPLHKDVTRNGVRFEVIGVFEEKGGGASATCLTRGCTCPFRPRRKGYSGLPTISTS